MPQNVFDSVIIVMMVYLTFCFEVHVQYYYMPDATHSCDDNHAIIEVIPCSFYMQKCKHFYIPEV